LSAKTPADDISHVTIYPYLSKVHPLGTYTGLLLDDGK